MAQEDIDHKLAAGRKEVIAHVDGEFEKLRVLLTRGFPNGDIDAHRRAHEEAMRLDADRKELVKKVTERTVGGVIWAVFAVIGLAVWEWFKNEVKK